MTRLHSSSFLSLFFLPSLHSILSPGFPFAFPSHRPLRMSLRESTGQMWVGDWAPGFSHSGLVVMKPSLFLVQDWLTKHPHQIMPGLLTAPQLGCLGGHSDSTGRGLGRSSSKLSSQCHCVKNLSDGSSFPHLLVLRLLNLVLAKF